MKLRCLWGESKWDGGDGGDRDGGVAGEKEGERRIRSRDRWRRGKMYAARSLSLSEADRAYVGLGFRLLQSTAGGGGGWTGAALAGVRCR